MLLVPWSQFTLPAGQGKGLVCELPLLPKVNNRDITIPFSKTFPSFPEMKDKSLHIRDPILALGTVWKGSGAAFCRQVFFIQKQLCAVWLCIGMITPGSPTLLAGCLLTQIEPYLEYLTESISVLHSITTVTVAEIALKTVFPQLSHHYSVLTLSQRRRLNTLSNF